MASIDEALIVDLADARTITVQLAWFPRLANGTPAQRANWRLIGGGAGIHRPDLNEDIGVEGLLSGTRFGETQASLAALAPGAKGGLIALAIAGNWCPVSPTQI